MKEMPGKFPFTRGIYPTMYRGQLWTFRQYAGFGSATSTNERFRHLLEQGQSGLSVAFDLPTQMGLDVDHPLAKGEVGRVGVSISSLEDMEQLFQKIPLQKVSTSMTINATAPILLCFYLALAKKNGVPFSDLRGTVQNDVLKEYIARGTYIFPPKPSLRLVTDLITYCAENVPKWNPISISGYHIREAGSDAIQEVAFTLSNALAYCKSVVDRGISFDQFASRLSFFFASHNDFLEEIAKFRAARRLWAKLSKDRLGAKIEKSSQLRFHAQTAGSTLTAAQPNNNIVRVTLQAMAAILGGCQSLHTNSKDEALALPTTESATLALRTQQILADETGIASAVDPVGGSLAIEKETDRIENEALAKIKEIDRMGGSIKAIESGYFQKAISERAYQYQKEIESQKRKIVGVNAYQEKEKIPPPLLKIDSKMEDQQRTTLASLKKKRDSAKAKKSLEQIEAVAKTDQNLIPLILEAVEQKSTLGEISAALQKAFGRYSPADSLA